MFYDNLKYACDKLGVKITPIVLECGGAKGSISNWKKGASPNSDIVAKLSVRLNVSCDFLILGKMNNPSIDQLSQNEQKLIKMYSLLSDMEKGEILGELKAMTRDRMIEKQDSNIQTVRMAARSTDNHPPEYVTGDFSDILNAPDATDEY